LNLQRSVLIGASEQRKALSSGTSGADCMVLMAFGIDEKPPLEH